MSDVRVDPPDPAQPLRPAARARRFRTLRTISALILREMQTTYGRSAGGYLWSLLEPIGGIALLTFIITSGFRVREPGLGNNFPLFLASGILMLTMFTTISNRVSNSLLFSRQLLFYPGVTFVDAIAARFILNLLTQLLVLYIILIGIHLLFDVDSIMDPAPILLAILLTAFMALGIGTLNCFLFQIFPIWSNIWTILTRPLVLISTIFFTYEMIPSEFRDIAWWNPLVHPIGLMRRGFYAGYDAAWASPLYVAVVGAVPLMLGLLFLHRFHRDLLNR